MCHINIYTLYPRKALGEAFGHVHGQVVSAMAAERNL